MKKTTTMKKTKAITCSIDRNGRLRKPNGHFATQADLKQINAKRIKKQLASWNSVRCVR